MEPVVVPLQEMEHGEVFHAYSLRSELIAPILGVDHAWMSGPTFPPHRHAGFSAVSYLFMDAEAGIRNRDSLGTVNSIAPGGLQWLAAGSGIVHEEVPDQPGRTVHSLQIFVDLPADQRGGQPFALTLDTNDVPVVSLPGVSVRIPLGNFGDASSPLNPPTPVTLLDVELEEGAVLDIPLPAGERAFLLPVAGTSHVDSRAFSVEDMASPTFPARDEPRTFRLEALTGKAHVVVFLAEPLASGPRSG
jgi:redox-sensitive bicupin YhaK (pirin superfamily)